GRATPAPVAAEAGEGPEGAEAPVQEAREGSDEEREADGDRRRRRRGRRGGRPRVRRDQADEGPGREEASETPGRPVAAETIEIVSPGAEAPAAEESDAAAAFAPWPGDAGLEAASLAPLAGDAAGSAPAHAEPHAAEDETPPPIAEAEPGIPFVSE